MFACYPLEYLQRRIRADSVRMQEAMKSRETLHQQFLDHCSEVKLRAQRDESHACQRFVRIVQRKKDKIKDGNYKWQLKALTAADVRSELDAEFRRTSEIRVQSAFDRLQKINDKRKSLAEVLLHENELRATLMRKTSFINH